MKSMPNSENSSQREEKLRNKSETPENPFRVWGDKIIWSPKASVKSEVSDMKIKFVAFSAGLLPAFLFLVSSRSQEPHEYVVKDLYVVDFPPGSPIGPAPVALGQTVIGSQLWLPPSGAVVELNPAFFSTVRIPLK